MKKAHNLLIGKNTAEDIKLKIGSVSEYDGEGAMDVKGRNLTDGLPKSVEVTSAEIRDVLAEPVSKIIASIKETLEVTLPELASDIIDRGIYLAGGSSSSEACRSLLQRKQKCRYIFPKSRLIA
mgnify:CR=1 FL=1